MDPSTKKHGRDMDIIRYKKSWFKVNPKSYEPERQTTQVAWDLIKNPNKSAQQAYREYFEKQREDAKILYPSFRKDNDN